MNFYELVLDEIDQQKKTLTFECIGFEEMFLVGRDDSTLFSGEVTLSSILVSGVLFTSNRIPNQTSLSK